MELVREFQTPTQNATTTQEIHSQETEEEQLQMEVTETAAEPEAEQEEADQMRDIDERSASLVMPPPPSGKEVWTTKEKKNWKRGCKKRNEGKGGGGW